MKGFIEVIDREYDTPKLININHIVYIGDGGGLRYIQTSLDGYNDECQTFIQTNMSYDELKEMIQMSNY